MKEATGEASMTGITIAIIAVVAAIAVPLVRMLVNNTRNSSCCASLGGSVEGNNCVGSSAGDSVPLGGFADAWCANE